MAQNCSWLMTSLFELFGFDFMPKDKCYGIWLFLVEKNNIIRRSLFTVQYYNGDILIDLFWIRVYERFLE